jgi:hypothetical protein
MARRTPLKPIRVNFEDSAGNEISPKASDVYISTFLLLTNLGFGMEDVAAVGRFQEELDEATKLANVVL